MNSISFIVTAIVKSLQRITRRLWEFPSQPPSLLQLSLNESGGMLHIPFLIAFHQPHIMDVPRMIFIFKDCIMCMWQKYDWIFKMQISRTVLPGLVGPATEDWSEFFYENAELVCSICQHSIWYSSVSVRGIQIRNLKKILIWEQVFFCSCDDVVLIFENENFLCVRSSRSEMPMRQKKKWINQIPLWFYSRHTDESALCCACAYHFHHNSAYLSDHLITL